MVPHTPRQFLLDIYTSAIEAVTAARCLPAHLPPAPRGRIVVFGAGKAAAAMARVVEQHYSGHASGLVITYPGHGAACARIEVVETAAPSPRQEAPGPAERATLRMLELAYGLGQDDLALCLLSAGAAALMALPCEEITLAGKLSVLAALRDAGATDDELDCVRTHLSAIQGGRLALACAPARVVTLVIDDGGPDGAGAIGPTLADPNTCAGTLAILDRYRVEVAPGVRELLSDGAAETPKPGDRRFATHEWRVVAGPGDALRAAAERARDLGVAARLPGGGVDIDMLDGGDAASLARIALAMAREGAPCVLLSRGGAGVGQNLAHGSNTGFALELVLALNGHPDINVIACATDGIDAGCEHAGALGRPAALALASAHAAAPRIDPHPHHESDAAARLFGTLGELIVTGPTRTDVGPFRAILILPADAQARVD